MNHLARLMNLTLDMVEKSLEKKEPEQRKEPEDEANAQDSSDSSNL